MASDTDRDNIIFEKTSFLQGSNRPFIRELYSIKGGKGACMIVEANSEEEILTKLNDLPFVKNNYLDIDIIEVF